MKLQNRKAFYDTARLTLFAGKITEGQMKLLAPLVEALTEWQSVDERVGAYLLATAHHETDRFLTMEEYASGEAYEGRADLGNTEPGDGRRFKGRGYSMLTGRKNYRDMSAVAGVDLLADPAAASRSSVASSVLISGAISGSFTGLGIAAFINARKVDFVNARKVINKLDRAETIADIAERYLRAIEAGNIIAPESVTPLPRSLEPMPETESRAGVPARRKPRFAQAIACGTSITVVWTAIAASGLLPSEIATPEVTNAISGLLSALASAFGLCNFFRPQPGASTTEGA